MKAKNTFETINDVKETQNTNKLDRFGVVEYDKNFKNKIYKFRTKDYTD